MQKQDSSWSRLDSCHKCLFTPCKPFTDTYQYGWRWGIRFTSPCGSKGLDKTPIDVTRAARKSLLRKRIFVNTRRESLKSRGRGQCSTCWVLYSAPRAHHHCLFCFPFPLRKFRWAGSVIALGYRSKPVWSSSQSRESPGERR